MVTLHATAVAIGGEALLIRGPSRSGKSRLALGLIACSTRARPILLIGDDRIVLRTAKQHTVAAPHPRIAGFIERRGLGIVAMPWTSNVPVAGTISIGAASPEPLADLPSLEIVSPCDLGAAVRRVLDWWAIAAAARATQSPRKGPARLRSCAKDWNW